MIFPIFDFTYSTECGFERLAGLEQECKDSTRFDGLGLGLGLGLGFSSHSPIEGIGMAQTQ